MKIKLIHFILFVFTGAFVFHACISDFTAPASSQMKGVLVVEGLISDGISTIKLSRTIGVDEESTHYAFVTDGRVEVECDDGTIFPTIGGVISKGEYEVHIAELDYSKKYRLKAYVGGEEYQSDFLLPKATSDMEVYWAKEAKGEPVAINVKIEEPDEKTRYYNWSYQQVYEFQSFLYKNFREVRDENNIISFIEQDEVFGPKNDILYCWNWSNSNTYNLVSSDQIAGKIINRRILEAPPTDIRFSYLYYIKVVQNELSEEGYEYFSVLKKNAEETGGIFSPILSELKGNIVCTSSPTIPVIGYIEVSHTITKELFIRPTEVYELPASYGCKSYTEKDAGYIPGFHKMYEYDFVGDPRDKVHYYANEECFDCTKADGIKRKPAFWPNDDE